MGAKRKQYKRVWHRSPTYAPALQTELLRLRTLDVIIPMDQTISSKGGVYLSPLFAIPKPDGRIRLIFNLKRLNTWLQAPPKFRMEGLLEVCRALRPHDFMAKIDLKDAYFHMGIHPQSRHLLAFRWEDQIWTYAALPFGLAHAPYVFTKLGRAILGYLRQQGIRMFLYLDDCLVIAETEVLLTQHVNKIRELFGRLGLVINEAKSSLLPTQTLTYLGLVINTRANQLELPEAKKSELHQLTSQLLEGAEVSPRQLARVLGKATAAIPAVKAFMAALRPALRWLTHTLRQPGMSWDQMTPMEPGLVHKLRQALLDLGRWAGRAYFPPTIGIVITTDASDSGWGAVCEDRISDPPQHWHTRGFWRRDQMALHINVREALACWFGLRAFLPLLPPVLEGDQVGVLFRTDNTALFFHLLSQGGHAPQISSLVEQIWTLTTNHHYLVQAEWIASEVNSEADALSRTTWDSDDWGLNPRYFRMADRKWGPFAVDLFATAQNRLCPRFFSRLPQPGALGIDALRHPWSTPLGALWANPPWPLISRVLDKVIRERVSLALVAPIWKSAPWYPTLQAMTVDVLPLPRRKDLFLPGMSGRLPMHNPGWRAAICLIRWPPSDAPASLIG